MNERLRELAKQASYMVDTTAGQTTMPEYKSQVDLEKFAMLVIQDYENDKRESRRDTMSELGYSRIGRGNV